MELSATGGARIWIFNASWPFATLSVTARRLSLSCGPFGSFEFSPEDVVRLEAKRTFFGLSGGVRFVHAKPEYPNEIVFWCFGAPDSLIRRIGALGFRPRPGPAQLAAAGRIEERSGNPMRWSFILGFLAAWNGLILLDWQAPSRNPPKLGALTLLAMALLVLVSFGVTRSSQIQSLVLKPGRSTSEILPLARLAQFISGAMVVATAIEFLFGSA